MRTKNNTIQFAFSIVLFSLAQLFMVLSVSAQYKDSVVFSSKAAEQSWVVPAGVTSIHIVATGAQGGGANGGKGGRVESDLKVNPEAKLIINVGSQPSGAEAGYNGGGKACGNGHGGGGATDIRIGSSGLDARVLVAGGGGGAGYGGLGGAGGGIAGGDGLYDNSEAGKMHFAKGGTQDAGGAGARAYFSPAGKAGVGGDGINNRGECSNGAMGAGGGGYYGGGGGGAGGGGGGSSYTNDSNSHVVSQQGVNEGNGRLVIYYNKAK